MNVQELKKVLIENKDFQLCIKLPDGDFVPCHFHVTEVGRVKNNFVDCGGVEREKESCLIQVWTAKDFEHRIVAGKLSKILQYAECVLKSDDLPVEIEFGQKQATQYKLTDISICEKDLVFVLAGKQTDCLAPDKCGVALPQCEVSCCGSSCC